LSKSVPASVRRAVMIRSHGICERCAGMRVAEMHHRLPRSRGGALIEDPFNIVGLCWDCHRLVHDTNERPWLVEGTVSWDKIYDRPIYVGPDPDYQEQYALAA
jgi:5-methylcytosine-specific restriction endonuclease McrA